MRLQDISFPVYKLEEHPPSESEGVVFYLKHKSGKSVVRIIDDHNLSGDTFAKRRVQLLISASTGHIALQKINTAIFFLGDFLRISKPNLYFIDSKGKIFKHTKTRNVPLVCRRITSVIRNIGSIFIEVDGLTNRFQCLYPPSDNNKFVSLLKLSAHNYLLYGFNESYHDNTVRKI